MANDSIGPRDPRWDAPVVGLDLRRSIEAIHADLRARYPRVVGLWWELEPDEKSGWVYTGSSHIVCKLVQT